MSRGLTSAGLAAAILMGMAASAAHAETKAAPGASFTGREAFTRDLNQWGPQRSARSLEWDAKKGKWGLKLDVERSQLRDMGWNEAGAGAYYKVTPGLRVGGGVSVRDQNSEGNGLAPRERAPRVKLETAFKF
ncbi:MAG TPA: hypothetical protein VF559_03850 [Caulobacteraceae bacterium]|jgi:hypothetical protein